MIAVVLLIGFTVAVGGILSVWLSTLTTTQTTTVSSGTEKQVRCAALSVVIKEVRFNTTLPCNICLNASYVNTTIRYESGTESLGPNVTFEVIGKGVRNTSTHVVTLNPGQAYTNSTNVSTSVGGAQIPIPPEVLRVRTFCQSTVPITAECKSGQPCMIGGTT